LIILDAYIIITEVALVLSPNQSITIYIKMENARSVKKKLMSDNQLKPCPFCGDEEADTSTDREFYFVVCQSKFCFANGPVAASEEKAMLAWNKRNEETK